MGIVYLFGDGEDNRETVNVFLRKTKENKKIRQNLNLSDFYVFGSASSSGDSVAREVRKSR